MAPRRKMTQEQRAKRRATKINNKRAKAEPLLAYAGLVEKTTPEVELAHLEHILEAAERNGRQLDLAALRDADPNHDPDPEADCQCEWCEW